MTEAQHWQQVILAHPSGLTAACVNIFARSVLADAAVSVSTAGHHGLMWTFADGSTLTSHPERKAVAR